MKSVEQYQHVWLEKSNHVAVVTINQPNRRDALDKQVSLGLEHVALSFPDDTDTSVVIFIASGTHFSAGTCLDRAMMHADSDQHVFATLTTDHDTVLSAYLSKKPGQFIGD